MEQQNQQQGNEPIAGLRRLTGHGLPGVVEPFPWLDALFVDPPLLSLLAMPADEVDAVLDDALEEDDESEGELLDASDIEEETPVAVTASAPQAAPSAAVAPTLAPAAAPPRDSLASMVLDALRKPTPAAAARADEHRVFGRFWHTYLPQPSARRSSREVDFVVQVCGLAPGARVLDAGCGAGRHTLELSRRGVVTAGVDASEELLEFARERSSAASLSATFVQADLRTLGFSGAFEAALLLDSTLGLHEDGETVEILRRLAASLVPGGRLLLEVLNRDFVLGQMPARKWLETSEAVILDDVSFHPETSRLRVKRSVAPHGGKAVDFAYTIRLYALHELRVLLSLAGFEVVEVAGSIHQRGAYLGSRDRSIWVTARKRSS